MRAVPDPWVALVIVAAGWRLWHLVAVDTILDRPREWFFYEAEAEKHPKLLLFVECPFCAGFWITVVCWLAWVITPEALWVLTPFALHTGMLAIEKLMDSGE